MLKTFTKENLESSLKEATKKLLNLARDICWNKISDNTTYIISEIEDMEIPNDFYKSLLARKEANSKKTPKSIEEITIDLNLIFENLYDINLHIYKSEKYKTIIEIRYYPKSSLNKDFYETVRNNNPMLHCKVSLPNYLKNKDAKFDINWELHPRTFKWKLFWRRQAFKFYGK